jgi:hypothetical protein
MSSDVRNEKDTEVALNGSGFVESAMPPALFGDGSDGERQDDQTKN